MTMRVVVKNEDPGRTANVREETFSIGEVVPSHTTSRLIGPGTEAAFYIHASMRLTVTEAPDVPQSAPDPAR